MALLTEELKGWIGREVRYPAREEVGRTAIRYFAVALGDDDPLYRDDDYARACGWPGVIAPPTFVVDSCQYADGLPDADGYVGHAWHLPIEGCRMIRAGNAYEFFRPVLATDRVSVTYALEDIVERSSSRGGTQLFVRSVARFHAADGELLAVNRETLVFQPLAPKP